MLFSKEINDMCSHDIANVVNRHQLFMRGRHNTLKETKITGKIVGRNHANLTDAESINKASKRRVLRFLKSVQYVLRTFLSHTLKPGNIFNGQMKQIIESVNQARFDHLLDQLIAQAFNVHRLA